VAIERRNLIKILGAGLGARATGISQQQHRHASPTGPVAANYTPRALTAAEYRVVDILADLILPTDETSPGAHDAGVARYIDIVLLYGDVATLASWQIGVKAVNDAAKAAHGRSFHEIPVPQQTDIVRTMAANETNPVSPMETLFVALKRLAIEAFYLSPAGKQSLGYRGDTAIARFPGCTDAEHKV
jgi:hypothetical protein